MAATRRSTFCWAPAPKPGEEIIPVPQSEEEEVIKAQIKKRMEASPGWFTKSATRSRACRKKPPPA
jgi:hypothetical protein